MAIPLSRRPWTSTSPSPPATAILVSPEAASISERPDRSIAHITGPVSYAKKLPPWENPTGEMVSFTTTNLSFRTIADQNFLFSYFTPTIPHGHGQTQNLVSLPFQNSTTGWNTDHSFACFNPETEDRSAKLMGIDVDSTEDTATAPPSKNPSSALLSRVSYLASQAAALSFNHSGSYHHHDYKFLGINATEFKFRYHGFSASSGGFVGFHNLTVTGCRITLGTLFCLDSIRDYVQLNTLISRGSGRAPRPELYRLPYKPRTRRMLLRIAIAYSRKRTRRMLSGRYGRRSTREHHVANRGKAASSWLEQAAVAASALIGLICAVAALLLCCIRSKRKQRNTAAVEPEGDEHIIRERELRRVSGPREFSCSELAVATDNFAEERKIGRGGFGPVYRGYFTDQDRHVAIKMLSEEQSVQGLREFQAEVTILSQLRHRNIVQLVGWCGRRRKLALVYELMPGGSLDTRLYNPDKHLTWSQRYKIALSLGTALRYLHAECEQCVVHGDIKPANVMLDASHNAKLGDFGLARLVPHGAEPRTTQVVAGTVGYIDPEFVNSRRPSAESDVYSFGVVLLEIACGRRPTSRGPGQASEPAAALLASVRELYHRNLIPDAADRRLDGEFDRLQMERLLVTGLWCAHHDPMRRPSVTQAIDVMRSQDAKLPVLEAMRGSGEEIHSLEEQAYGDLSDENSASLHGSTETAYLTTEE